MVGQHGTWKCQSMHLKYPLVAFSYTIPSTTWGPPTSTVYTQNATLTVKLLECVCIQSADKASSRWSVTLNLSIKPHFYFNSLVLSLCFYSSRSLASLSPLPASGLHWPLLILRLPKMKEKQYRYPWKPSSLRDLLSTLLKWAQKTRSSEQLLKSSTVLHWRCCLGRDSSPSRPTCTRPSSLVLPSFTKPPHFLRWRCGTYMCLLAVSCRHFGDNSWRINKI